MDTPASARQTTGVVMEKASGRDPRRRAQPFCLFERPACSGRPRPVSVSAVGPDGIAPPLFTFSPAGWATHCDGPLVLLPGNVSGRRASLLVVVHGNHVRACAESPCESILRSRLIHPTVHDQVSVDVQPHAVGSQHRKRVSALGKRETTLPQHGKIVAWQRSIRNVAGPIEVNLRIGPYESGSSTEVVTLGLVTTGKKAYAATVWTRTV